LLSGTNVRSWRKLTKGQSEAILVLTDAVEKVLDRKIMPLKGGLF
jgi:hypothetical protein